MWIVVIIIIIVLIVVFLSKLNNQTRKIEKEGGMKNKYSRLIQLIRDEDINSRIIFEYKERIDIGLRNIDGETVFSLILSFGNLEVICRIRSKVNGDHEMKWNFPEYYDQNRMFEKIKFELSKYLNNVFSSKLSNETFDNKRDTERRLSLLRIASNLKCNPNEVKERYLKDFENQDFDKFRIDKIIQILESKKNDEATMFDIDSENTGAALMIEWSKEYFNQKESKNIKVDKEDEFKKKIRNNPELVDSLINILSEEDVFKEEKKSSTSKSLLKTKIRNDLVKMVEKNIRNNKSKDSFTLGMLTQSIIVNFSTETKAELISKKGMIGLTELEINEIVDEVIAIYWDEIF